MTALFAYPGFPHDIGVSQKDGETAQTATFMLDFSKRLTCLYALPYWPGKVWQNRWVGVKTGLLVPVRSCKQVTGYGFVIPVDYDDPYFRDIPKLWKRHAGSTPTMIGERGVGEEV
jgi:hypothetical protein